MNEMDDGRLPVRRTERRQLIRFEPTFNTGHIVQVAVLVLGGIGAYGTYTSDKAVDRADVAQIKRDAEAQRLAVKETLSDLRADVKDIQHTLIDVSQSIAVLKARQDPPKRTP